ncbi:CAP domain-containing protein [Pseudomonas panipatensis]|uniref:Cysteine-rich secretory protein family protein n=1 Tax=Pseudomonas panipatensis TaxID=428992 RepID=A0A1G8DQD6_9PSED|nr:CAP domain-containing protein [Pseudomonas panipatensis]SDH59659.1 Cysteine-rich secretory protein family protein [Pseudomonas panipatensis]SMP40337.1 Cysteine-rich secretory protein family protein [Pseudomonas panipatensis]
MRRSVRFARLLPLCLIPLQPLLTSPAQASGERQLAAAINDYRAHPARCEGRRAPVLAPLQLKSSLALPVGEGGALREAVRDNGYQAVAVRSIRLAGAEDADAAFDLLEERYCGALLDAQYADIGISRAGREWRVVLAKPLLDSRLNDSRATDKTLLAQVNAARARPRLCGRQRFGAARPLTWNAALGTAAQRHSRDMAEENYFSHQDPDGRMPDDRARAAGFRGRQVGENIAAGQGSAAQAMAGWLASPGHCANLMNPLFTQVGAGYATDSRSDHGVYWTMDFGGR